VAADLTRPSVWIKGLATFWRHDKTREAIGVLAMAAAVLTLAAVATFDPHDPSFFSFASMTDRQVRNAVGRVGAEVGGDLLGLLGLSALLVPPALFCWGWAWVGGKRPFHAWPRGVSLFLLVPSVSLLAAVLHQVRLLPGGRVERPGGYLGDELFRLLVFFFGTFGLAVLALTGVALAAISLSGRSCVSLLAWPSAALHWLACAQAERAGQQQADQPQG